MNKKLVIHLVSVIIIIVAISMFATTAVSLWMKDHVKDTVIPFLICSAFTLVAGILTFRLSVPGGENGRKAGVREGFAIVGFSWLAASLFGMLPFIAIVGMHSYDAFFETMSGFSTTGATVIDNSLPLMFGKTLPSGIESLPKGILFWRAVLHWLGGMGIVVLTIAVLPLMNLGGQVLYNAEVTGVKSMDSRLTPRIASSAKILWAVYCLLTFLETIFLRVGGMDWFDAVCHSFSTIASGGFSTKTDSIAYYNSPFIDWVITLFMFLAGCNFVLHFRLVSRKPLAYLKDEEFRFYSILVLACIAVVSAFLILTPPTTANITNTAYYHNPLDAVRAAAFQVVSIISTTGFTTTDYTIWPTAACVILFGITFIGGCGGSTAGGLKCVRVMLLIKHSILGIRRCIYPNIVPDIRLNQKRLDDIPIQKTIAFFSLFITLYCLCVLILACVCPKIELLTALSASVACLTNTGPGFAQISPEFSFAWMTWPAKILLAFEMLLGRLELYTLLVFLLPSFWKK